MLLSYVTPASMSIRVRLPKATGATSPACRYFRLPSDQRTIPIHSSCTPTSHTRVAHHLTAHFHHSQRLPSFSHDSLKSSRPSTAVSHNKRHVMNHPSASASSKRSRAPDDVDCSPPPRARRRQSAGSQGLPQVLAQLAELVENQQQALKQVELLLQACPVVPSAHEFPLLEGSRMVALHLFLVEQHHRLLDRQPEPRLSSDTVTRHLTIVHKQAALANEQTGELRARQETAPTWMLIAALDQLPRLIEESRALLNDPSATLLEQPSSTWPTDAARRASG